MPILSRLRSLWRTLARKERIERELDEELRAAVRTLAARYAAQGMSAEAARRAAVVALGGVEQTKEEVRDARVGAALDAFLLDVRYAWRWLWKTPALTAVIVVTLALGIGANTAIFSVVHAMLLEPLPFRDPDRLVFVWLDRSDLGYPRWPLSGPDLRALRQESGTCVDFGAIWTNTAALTDGDPEQLRIGFVTHNFFQVLGAESALGRTFRPEDSAKGAAPAMLLSWDLFQRRFGADPSVVGRRIRVDERQVLVVGVMPKGFRLLLPPDSSVPDDLQAWVPFWPDVESSRNRFLRVVARLRPGASVSQTNDDLAAIAAKATRERGIRHAFTAIPLHTDDVREIRAPLLALFAGVGILLMIACVNVASLLIARAHERTKETALRLALGAGRGRLLRQSLAEGLLLTLLGAAAGLAAGAAGLRVLLALAPESLGRLQTSRIDLTVFAFTLGVSAAWGLLFSLAPLTEVFKADPARSLQRQSRTTAVPLRYRARAALVILQIALSLVLLVSAGLLLRAFVEVLRVHPGFGTAGQWTFRMAIPGRYESHDAFNLFAAEVQRRLAAMPGATGAGAISHLPYDDLPNWGLKYSLQTPRPPDAPTTDARALSPGLFEMLGVRLVEGRFFTEEDRNPKSPVAIVDEKLARELWPGRSALGQKLYTAEDVPNVVVGVVRHLKLRSLVDDLNAQIYVPWRITQRNPIAWIVRTDRDAAAFTAQVRAAVAAVDPRVPIYDVRPMASYVEEARATRRFTMVLAAAFAASALALTCIGVYGVLAYAVAHRRHEFGVRRALGANTPQVIREVMREGVRFALAGCAAGIVGAAVAARMLQSQLYAVDPADPVTYGAAVGILFGGAAAACWIPARRATAVSPVDALRTE